MNQITPHTEPHSNSKAAANGYEPYTSTPNKAMYVGSSKPGYTYFGARYYASDLSVWLSVDPLSDARPSLSPYNYASLNPIMRIDPTGMLDDWVERDGKIVYDKNVTKGEDNKVQNLKAGDKYLGVEGSALNEETGKVIIYKRDGSTAEKKARLSGVEVHPNYACDIDNPSKSTNNNNGYIWDAADLAIWKHMKNSNDPISRYVKSSMARGYYPILDAGNAYRKNGYLTTRLQAFKGYLDVALVLQGDPRGKLKLTRSSKYFNPSSSKSTTPPSYKQFLKNTKGKYRGGKRGENFKRARADYRIKYGR
jgi:RHS repeat-associated protein